ncbi:uncharacterized protein LOC130781394 [Actinidia eriantha]|uniref:uncharacterized protein LOC130781394 n=1 Tax=Actinidia eriantha TaxID=165200 RepID=UPI00258C3807|nr:uncharacterized protein LOC130781394 [Actinidia eriantha]
MASYPSRSKARFHARSVSLPSRRHPLIPQFDEHLSRVRASEATSSSLSSIGHRLNGLEDLYDCVDDLLQLPHAQHMFFQERQEKWVEEALDGYLKLVDACATAKDVFSQMKQDVQDLGSVLRRRRDANDFSEYLTSRKKAKKVIQKPLKDLKSMKSKHTSLASDKDHETMAIITMLNEVEAATFAVFESLLSHPAGTKEAKMKSTNTNDFEKVDAQLQLLSCCKKSKSANTMHVENVQNLLGKMESDLIDVEGELECLLRRLIKTRVSLLNILNV